MDKRDLPETAFPFATMALDSTKWSNCCYRATFEMPVRKEDAPRAIEKLAQHFRALGWREVQGSEQRGGTLIDPAPGPGEFTFYSAADGGKSGIRVALTHFLGAVNFEYTDMALLRQHAGEAFGDSRPARHGRCRRSRLSPQR